MSYWHIIDLSRRIMRVLVVCCHCVFEFGLCWAAQSVKFNTRKQAHLLQFVLAWQAELYERNCWSISGTGVMLTPTLLCTHSSLSFNILTLDFSLQWSEILFCCQIVPKLLLIGSLFNSLMRMRRNLASWVGFLRANHRHTSIVCPFNNFSWLIFRCYPGWFCPVTFSVFYQSSKLTTTNCLLCKRQFVVFSTFYSMTHLMRDCEFLTREVFNRPVHDCSYYQNENKIFTRK